ncbi:MAG TPA: enoyl-CoA hydratase-related protein [Ktedonobacteraceae bacterium]|jgi:2-(1,2-epoxy-1,2-dihydrophenyl)acetyl-CoA isomerase|nr:enoyl-CoA hydratase-related protein [Ktedonobacteraceae bacterium]
MQTDFQALLLEREEGIVTITMNRPEVLNALNEVMVAELVEVFDEVAHDESVRCIVLTGAGGSFGAGQDLRSFTQARDASESTKASEHLQQYHRLVYLIQEMPKPVLAAVRGVAAGISANLAFACDMRIASDDARFIEAFSRIGLVPDGGGGYFLPRLVGLGRALEMALLADEVNGVEAERIGLVNRCVPLASFEATTRALARRLAQGPTRSYAFIKELMYKSLDLELQSVLTLEGKLQAMAMQTADHREGVNAFLQKRAPHFEGN